MPNEYRIQVRGMKAGQPSRSGSSFSREQLDQIARATNAKIESGSKVLFNAGERGDVPVGRLKRLHVVGGALQADIAVEPGPLHDVVDSMFRKGYYQAALSGTCRVGSGGLVDLGTMVITQAKLVATEGPGGLIDEALKTCMRALDVLMPDERARVLDGLQKLYAG